MLREDLPKACRSLVHRGPDDSGYFYSIEDGIGLGHTRLSILDLSSAGHQPMSSDEGGAGIVYNGEIYNFREVGKKLEECGYQFRSSSDTEVVLKAYLHWGTQCLDRFIGMFAFAIWDDRNRSLFLARDRLGIKPLYYWVNEAQDMFIFASELKAIMAFGGFVKSIDPEALPLFLHYQYIPAPRTIFANTYKLLPGHFLVSDPNGIKIQPYWSLPDNSHGDLSGRSSSETEMLEGLDNILTAAVADRLISDVPLGALLSGGIDSSLVVSLMQKVSAGPVKTFTIGFREEGYNEAPWASKIAAHLRTDHTELYVTPQDATDVIPQLPEIYDEPFADSSAIPTFLVSKLTRRKVTVALSGDGGDEQFCGYVRYWSTQAMTSGFRHLPSGLRRPLAAFLRKLSPSWVEKAYRPLSSLLPQGLQVANFSDKWQKLLKQLEKTEPSELYRMTICLWPAEEIRHMLARSVVESAFEDVFRDTGGWPLISRLMRVDQRTYLPDAMLTKVDRASMAVALEVRVPLLDHRVVEFTAGLPEHVKFRNGSGKYLLKQLLAKYVPRDLFERPKMGFGVPIGDWFRNELKELLRDYLGVERLKSEGTFDAQVVEEKISEHLSGRTNHQYRLWSLLMWEMWRERWL
jgi:asparagine synthase (glutamine-hydrolysing)